MNNQSSSSDKIKIQANIKKLFVIKTAKWLMLYMPIIWLFYEENGLTIADLFIIQSIYSITIAFIEIPSGYVADVLGRRNSIVIGTFFGLIGMIVYLSSLLIYKKNMENVLRKNKSLI